MIVDYQNRIPAFVVHNDKLIHQHTGEYIMLHSRSNKHMRNAVRLLIALLHVRGYSVSEIFCSTVNK